MCVLKTKQTLNKEDLEELDRKQLRHTCQHLHIKNMERCETKVGVWGHPTEEYTKLNNKFFTTSYVVKSTQKSYGSKSKHMVLKCYLGEKRLHDAAKERECLSGRP